MRDPPRLLAAVARYEERDARFPSGDQQPKRSMFPLSEARFCADGFSLDPPAFLISSGREKSAEVALFDGEMEAK